MRVDLTSGAIKTPTLKVEPPGRKLGNFLREYGNFTAENEAPEAFHLWVGLGTVAGAVRRRISMQTQYYEVLTNMFIVLVAPPGTARKTTALKIGQGLLKKVPGIHFTSKAGSPAALIKQMADLPEKDHQSLTAYAYELGTMLGTSSAEMVDLLTDLYDGNPDWDKQTISRGMEKITRPWLNLLGATTPQWLGDYMSPTAVEGGFVSRSIFVYQDERKLSNPFPELDPEMERLKKLLINDLTHISTLNGEFKFHPETMELYKKWYLDQGRFPKISDNRTSGYYERKHIHVLKVAMALSLCQKDELVLLPQDLVTAQELLTRSEPGMHRSFSSVGRNIFATDLERIYSQIERNGGMAYGALVAANYHALRKAEIDEILQNLRDMNKVEIVKGGIYKARNGKNGTTHAEDDD